MPKVNTKLWVKRYKIVMAMAEIIKNLNNAYAGLIFMPHVMIYDTLEGSAEYIACHDDIYEKICNQFFKLIEIYGKEGII